MYQRSEECTVLHDCTIPWALVVVHKVWQRFPTTHKFTTAPAHGWHLHYANGTRSYNGMQSIEYYTGCCTKLYAVRACCTVCNTHAERSCEAMAEWVMLKLIYGMPIACQAPLFFRFGHSVNIGVPSGIASWRQCRQERPSLRKSTAKFFFKRPARYTFVMAGEKLIGEALLVDGLLRKLGPRNLQTQTVLFRKNGPPLTSLHGVL